MGSICSKIRPSKTRVQEVSHTEPGGKKKKSNNSYISYNNNFFVYLDMEEYESTEQDSNNHDLNNMITVCQMNDLPENEYYLM